MNPYVKSVQANDDYSLFLTFENGEKRIFDVQPYFDKPVFARLKNLALFKTARVVSGSVEWQGEIDLSYDTLYLGSQVANEGLPQSSRGGKKHTVSTAARKNKASPMHGAAN